MTEGKHRRVESDLERQTDGKEWEAVDS